MFALFVFTLILFGSSLWPVKMFKAGGIFSFRRWTWFWPCDIWIKLYQNWINTVLNTWLVTALYFSLYLIKFCYHGAWHLKDLAVKEHTLDWSPWPSDDWFSVQAQSSDCSMLFSFSPRHYFFPHSLVPGRCVTFCWKHTISGWAVDPRSWPLSQTLWRARLPHPLP